MKTRFLRQLICVLALLVKLYCVGALELSPGLTYYDTKNYMEGRLLFLISDGPVAITNETGLGTIYEFDLQQKQVRPVVRAPSGTWFQATEDANSYLVIYARPSEVPIGWITPDRLPHGAFMYCRDLQQRRTVLLPERPKNALILGHHFFLQVVGTNGLRILHCDLGRGTERLLDLPQSSRWEGENFEFMRLAESGTNRILFEYFHQGARLTQGKDYPSAQFYTYDAQSGQIEAVPYAKIAPISFRCRDGRFVWFDGPESPFVGRRLMQSSWPNERDFRGEGSQERDTRLLKKFYGSRASRYCLQQMSPCGSYALIRHTEQSQARSVGAGQITTYYIVDVVSGTTRTLLKDEVAGRTGRSMSLVRWVRER